MVHIFALLRRCNQVCHGILADWDIGKVPAEFASLCNHIVHPFFAADNICVLAVIAGGEAEDDAVLLQNIHVLTPELPL